MTKNGKKARDESDAAVDAAIDIAEAVVQTAQRGQSQYGTWSPVEEIKHPDQICLSSANALSFLHVLLSFVLSAFLAPFSIFHF